MTHCDEVKSRTFGLEALCVSLVTCVAYFIFITHFLINNHTPRLPWTQVNDQVWAGRWFNYFLNAFNYRADIPVLFPLMGVAAAVFCAFMSLSIWRQNLRTGDRIVVAIALTTFPVSLAYFYYTYQTPLFYSAWIFGTLAAYLSLRERPVHGILAALLVTLCCASNQTSINIFPVLIATAAIARLADGSADPKAVARILLRSGLILVAGLGMYFVSLKIAGISTPGSSSIVSLSYIPQQMWTAISGAFSHLWLTQPELPRSQKIALLAVLIVAICVSIYKTRKSLPLQVLTLALWFIAILGTKMLSIVVEMGSMFEYRYSGALAYFYAFTFAFVLGSIDHDRKIVGYVALALLAFITLRYVQADLVRQSVLLRGQQHDLALANRILYRIEALPGLDTSERYDFVRIGAYSNYRSDLLSFEGKGSELAGDTHMDHGEITASWTDESVFRLLGSGVQFEIDGYDGQFAHKVAYAKEHLLVNRAPWPHKSSVFMVDDTIYVYMR